jgi:hypothetical protein
VPFAGQSWRVIIALESSPLMITSDDVKTFQGTIGAGLPAIKA